MEYEHPLIFLLYCNSHHCFRLPLIWQWKKCPVFWQKSLHLCFYSIPFSLLMDFACQSFYPFLVISAYFHFFFSIYVLMSSAFLHHQCCCMYNGRELTFLILPAFSSLVFLKELFKLILSNSLPSKRCFNKTSTWFWCMPTRLENHFPSLYLEVNQEAHYYYYKLWVHIMVFRGMLIYTYSDTEESAFDWLRWCLNLETVIVGELVRFKFCLWVTKNPNGKIFFSL